MTPFNPPEKSSYVHWLYFFGVSSLITFWLFFRNVLTFTYLNIIPISLSMPDYSSGLARLHFLNVYGFHAFVPNWYGGFISLQFSPPGWYFLALPFLRILQSFPYTLFATLLLLYAVGALIFYVFGKRENYSSRQILLYYLIFFFNIYFVYYASIGIGRLPDFFGWIIGVTFMFYVFELKRKTTLLRYFLLIPLFSILILSYYYSLFFAGSFLLSIWLIKPFKDKVIILFVTLVSLILTGFWWVSFVTAIQGATIPLKPFFLYSNPITPLTGVNAAFLLLFLFTAFLYFHFNNPPASEWLFFSPQLILAFLFVSGTYGFFPVFNLMSMPAAVIFSIFLTVHFFFKLNLDQIPHFFRNVLKIGLHAAPFILLLIGIIFSLQTLTISYTPTEESHLRLASTVDDKILIYTLDSSQRLKLNEPILAHATIYSNITTPSGWFYEVAPRELNRMILDLSDDLNFARCDKIHTKLKSLKTPYLLVEGPYCMSLLSCDFTLQKKDGSSCLLFHELS